MENILKDILDENVLDRETLIVYNCHVNTVIDEDRFVYIKEKE